jgi:hypothetical protein
VAAVIQVEVQVLGIPQIFLEELLVVLELQVRLQVQLEEQEATQALVVIPVNQVVPVVVVAEVEQVIMPEVQLAVIQQLALAVLVVLDFVIHTVMLPLVAVVVAEVLQVVEAVPAADRAVVPALVVVMLMEAMLQVSVPAAAELLEVLQVLADLDLVEEFI